MEALLLKIPEVAARLGISRAKVYELMGSGSLPSVRVDGCRRVRTEDLLAFVANLHPVAEQPLRAVVAVRKWIGRGLKASDGTSGVKSVPPDTGGGVRSRDTADFVHPGRRGRPPARINRFLRSSESHCSRLHDRMFANDRRRVFVES